MKYYLFVLVMAAGLLVKCTSQKNVAYEFPAEMAEPIRVEYVKQCDKGQILYNMNCAGCHTRKINGKKVIPDFTAAQLVGYGIRLTNTRHESTLTDTTVSEEELGLIMTFLSYKKKNTAP